jgi:hypothetical protein
MIELLLRSFLVPEPYHVVTHQFDDVADFLEGLAMTDVLAKPVWNGGDDGSWMLTARRASDGARGLVVLVLGLAGRGSSVVLAGGLGVGCAFGFTSDSHLLSAAEDEFETLHSIPVFHSVQGF